ncbi:hypothetical protein CYLTODRAFT_113285 [Cylindrobasidium torrendii FP15055 ss-10]|uniref:Uncharacterized protein n=1 Tax=Cylindrobasidium torrendii FP15055 ss-10 TaxID=1314674 RepID=A0A0D7B0U2_9AGAR|nr:hypothetical protein CYLTODRAFT_113285 [Cylindrobasidium torrendii FP15055 ss-10]
MQSNIRIADANCPEWDISKPRDVFRLGLFLQYLRTEHRDKLERKFDEVKKEVSDSWKHKESWMPRERVLREWKMSKQKEGPAYREWLERAKEAWPEFSRLQALVDHARSAVVEAENAAREEDDSADEDNSNETGSNEDEDEDDSDNGKDDSSEDDSSEDDSDDSYDSNADDGSDESNDGESDE